MESVFLWSANFNFLRVEWARERRIMSWWEQCNHFWLGKELELSLQELDTELIVGKWTEHELKYYENNFSFGTNCNLLERNWKLGVSVTLWVVTLVFTLVSTVQFPDVHGGCTFKQHMATLGSFALVMANMANQKVFFDQLLAFPIFSHKLVAKVLVNKVCITLPQGNLLLKHYIIWWPGAIW